MNNENVWKEILAKKEITTKDRILFRTIQDVLSSVFTDENHISLIKVGYTITDQLHIWFPNIIPSDKKNQAIENGYAIYMAEDWNTIYKYDSNKTLKQQQALGLKLVGEKIHFITFAKILEKAKGIGYHFVGIFIFDKFADTTCQTMIYKKISDNYKLKK